MAGLLFEEEKPKTGVADALGAMSANLFGQPASIAAPGPQAPDRSNPLPLPTPSVPTVAPAPPPLMPENDSVEKRMAGLLSSGSDYIRMARASGYRGAAARGLRNSTMAEGAAQGAAIERALPIATTDAQIAAQKNLTREDQAAQMTRLNTSNTAEMARLERQGEIQGTLSAQEQAASLTRQREMIASEETRLGRQLTAQEQQQVRDLASRETMQQREFTQQYGTLQYQASAAMQQLETQLMASSRQQDRALAADMQKLQVSAANEMDRLTAQLRTADAQQQREISSQMERLRVSTDAEMARLTQAAGYDMSRLQAQGALDISRDAAQATNAQELARVQGSIQSAMQAQGNTEQIQRMGIELGNQLQLQGAQLGNDMQKIAAAGDQDIRRLVEAANQERVTLSQSIAAQDRERMAAAMVNIFQVEAQMRAALLGNTTIPASERAAYERSITSLGDPIRNYVNQLFGTPQPGTTPSPGGAPIMTVPSGGSVVPDTAGTSAGGLLQPTPDLPNIGLSNQFSEVPVGPSAGLVNPASMTAEELARLRQLGIAA